LLQLLDIYLQFTLEGNVIFQFRQWFIGITILTFRSDRDTPISNDGMRKVYAVVVTKEEVVERKSDYISI
jgi:hypothetical protein